jgi:NADH dehydrogenase FAD-containing subunit/CubicO group peptidase (beta-lactamase class C family)
MRFGLPLLLAMLAPGAARAQGGDSTQLRRIDEYVTHTMRSARFPGVAVGIVKGDRVVYLHGFGRADPSGRPVTPQTPFLIGSVTKSFTALAVLQLVERGQVELDAPVQRYIPWFRVDDSVLSSQITVRQLLTMTSGLPQVYETQVWTDRDDGALERTVRFLATKQLTGQPGHTFGYSNANYETLGLIVQTVSGESYEDYVKRHILGPLDMRNSFVSQDEALARGMASGYRWWFGVPVAVMLPYRRAELPAGYVIASTEDMTHYLIAEMNGGRYGDTSVLSPRGMAMRHAAPSGNGYGMGWEFAHAGGRTLINHDGGTANFQSSLFIDPDAQVGVYVAANAINALDAFASPHGLSPLDGQTTRAMAQTILSLATNQPLPDQGIGHRRLTLIFDVVIVLLSVALVMSLARIRRRHRRMAQQGIASRAALWSRVAIAVVLHFALGIALLLLWPGVPAWPALMLFEPDLATWLAAVAIVLFVKGVLELLFIARVYQRSEDAKFLTHRSRIGTRVVVVGGGIGGLAAARHLDRLLGGRRDVEITLVNRDNFFLLSPLLFEACSGVLELRHCAQPIRPCLRRVQFIEATAREIDVERRIVRVAGPGDVQRELAYDHVVIALGAATNLSLIRGSEYAGTFKMLLRNHVIEQLERANVETDADRRRGALTITVVGGGLVGVELIGELTAFIEDELEYYPEIRRDELRFHLFEAGNRLLPESKPFLAEYAERLLRRRGAELHVGTPVQEIGPGFVRWADGWVDSQTIVLAAGIVPNPVAAAANVARDRRGRILTDPTLRSTSDPRVWAFGDCASTPSPEGTPYPALAQHAVRAARVAARNVAAALDGHPAKPFVYEPLGMMAAFGHTRAACDVRGIKLSGFIAWWIRRTYYLFQMPRWDTRFRIAFDWTVALFSRPDLTKIDLAEERELEQRNHAADGSPRGKPVVERTGLFK